MARGGALIPVDAIPLAGGYSGETFGVEAFGERAVLRVYGQAPERAPIDAALMRLVRGLVPLPEVLDVRLGLPWPSESPDKELDSGSPTRCTPERLNWGCRMSWSVMSKGERRPIRADLHAITP